MPPLCLYTQTTCLSPYRRDAQNDVSVPISASDGFLHRLRQQRIGTRDNSQATPQSGDKTQTTCLSLYLGPQPNNEPVTLFRLTPKGRVVVTALLAAREADTEKVTKLAA
ncbi:MAG: hypothetical protein GX456_12015 [Verrucomicrobia bacterium]|nr:hypothetical protein [Verrucomicrobiota bacterium]